MQRTEDATPPSPPTRVQRTEDATPPSPPTRVQRTEDATPPSPPTRVQRTEDATPASPPTRVQQTGEKPADETPEGAKSAGRQPVDRAAPDRPADKVPPSPPTRHQSGATVGPDPVHDSEVPTSAPSRGTPRTRRARGSTPNAEFPEALRRRGYHPIGIAGAGSEGTVWHVRLDEGRELALKIAHPGQSMDLDTLRHLAAPEFQRHVPEIVEFDEVAVGAARCGWVAMEYLPETLDDHLAGRQRTGARRGERIQAEGTVQELAELLDFWQTRIDRNPLDLKPANILVRSRGRGGHEFVVADFGGIARFTASQSYREFQVTPLYTAPEQIVHQNLKATPWWTLGLVLYQVFVGRPLYVLDDDARITDTAWTRGMIMNGEVDLTAVADPRQNLLLQGLLTKDPDDRWTAAEVRRWLKGESPEVVRPEIPEARPTARHANRPITFRGEAHHEAENLAAAMARNSQEAADWLAADGGRRLAAWLRDELHDTSFDIGQLQGLDRGPARPVRAAVAALAFVAVFAPTATPQYRGRRVDAEGIARIAQSGDAVTFIDELIGASVPTVAAGFRCGHDGCVDRCRLLLALADELPLTIEGVRAEARTLGHRDGRNDDLTPYERNIAYGLSAALIVRPADRKRALLPLAGLPGALAPLAVRAPLVLLVLLAHLNAVRHRVTAAVRQRGGEAPFLRRWAGLHRRAAAGSPAAVSGRTALVAAVALLPRLLRADALGQDHEVTLAEWWSVTWPPLGRRVWAATVLFTVVWVLTWCGAMARTVVDSGIGWAALKPEEALVAPLTRAADAASVTIGGLCAVALAAALAFVLPRTPVSGRVLVLGAALAVFVGYRRPDLPPLEVLHAPAWLVERARWLLGGWRSWNGVVALAALVLCFFLLSYAARHLARARAAEQQQAGLRRARAERRRTQAGLPGRPYQNPAAWRTGSGGMRDRGLFALAGVVTLVVVLGAAVEFRLALTGDHATLVSWGTGQQGAAYQSHYLAACAALCALAAVCAPRTARRILGGGLLAVAVLGAWPPPVEPAQAVSVPVWEAFFAETAATWGPAAFWAALLLALPLAGATGAFALRRTRSEGR
ncbi:protein kinase domain-containing protein [Streptomyces sp. NPDC055103]